MSGIFVMTKEGPLLNAEAAAPKSIMGLSRWFVHRCFYQQLSSKKLIDWCKGAGMISRVVTWTGHGREALPCGAKLRVGIASSGRFHLLDLARELDALGVEVCFYSYLPRTRAQTFGLPGRCLISLFPILFPLVVLERLFPRIFPRTIERLMCWALDVLTILRMRRCDVFICLSGIYLHAPRFAQWRYGARVVLHRGSR